MSIFSINHMNRFGRLLLPVVCLACPCVAEDNRAGKASVSELVISELKSANQARQTLLKERQQWQAEEQRLKLLISTIKDRIARYKSEIDDDNVLIGQLEEKGKKLASLRARLESLSSMIDKVSGWLEKRIDAIEADSLPGLIAPKTKSGYDSAGQFSAIFSRLTKSIERGADSAVELVAGHLGDKEITVKLIRAGGAAAWWVSLDGARSGHALMKESMLILTEAENEDVARRIMKVLAVLETRAAPEIVVLPIKRSLSKTKGEQK